MLLADAGADVIRLERVAEAGTNSNHLILHRGRRSVALDLKSSRGIEIALKIVASVEGLIEGFRPGVADKLGLVLQP